MSPARIKEESQFALLFLSASVKADHQHARKFARLSDIVSRTQLLLANPSEIKPCNHPHFNYGFNEVA